MNTFSNSKNKPLNPRSILGGIPGLFDETGFETESLKTVVSAVAKGAGTVFEAITSLGQDIAGVENKDESKKVEKFPSKGSIGFNEKKSEQTQKQKEELERKKAFFQSLKEDQDRTQREKDKLLFEEEINDIVTNLPTEQKNRLLHYQAGYKDSSIYQRAELRRKIIEEKNKREKEQKEASIPSPAKQPSALEGAFEGGSGTQGSGTANLSAQATG